MISIVVPTYSRGMLLYKTIRAIDRYLGSISENYEIILVLDGRDQRTELCVRKLYRQYPCVKGVLLDENVGQQNATLAGIRQAKGDYVITMDDDLEHDCNGIPKMLTLLDDGYDVVYGVCQRPGRRLHRSFGTWVKELVFEVVLQKPKAITLSSYKAMTRALVTQIIEDDAKFVYISAAILNRKPKVGQVEVESKRSIDRRSGYSVAGLVKVLWRVMVYYSHWPLVSSLKQKGHQYRVKERLE